MKLIFGLLLAGVLGVYAMVHFFEGPIQPKAWEAPVVEQPKLTKYVTTHRLFPVEVIARALAPTHQNPRYFDFLARGLIAVSYETGLIAVLNQDGALVKEIVNTNSRPMSFRVMQNGGLIIADAYKGIMRFHPRTGLEVLVNAVEGRPLGLIGDLLVDSRDNMVYFTETSTRFKVGEEMLDILEHGTTGSLFGYSLETGQVTKIASGFAHPKGLTFGPDEAFVMMVESNNHAVWQIIHKGERIGEKKIFADNIPGYPSFISFNGSNRYWIAIPYARETWHDWLADKPHLRSVLARIPMALLPKLTPVSYVIGLSKTAAPLDVLESDAAGSYFPVTVVKQQGKTMYLGSSQQPGLGRFLMPRSIHDR